MIVDKSVSVSPLEQVLMELSARVPGLTRLNNGGEPGKAAEEERRTKDKRAHSDGKRESGPVGTVNGRKGHYKKRIAACLLAAIL